MLKKLKLFALAALTQLSFSSFVNAQNATATLTGTVDTSSGSIAALVSPGDPIDASAVLVDSVNDANEITEDDVLDIAITAGGLCLYVDIADCPGGTITLPLVANPGNPSSYVHPPTLVTLAAGGPLTIVSVLLGQEVEITISFGAPVTDTTVGGIRTVTGSATFFADGSPDLPGETDLGDATGSLTYELSGPVTEQAAVPMLPILFNVVLFASLVFGWRKYKTSVK